MTIVSTLMPSSATGAGRNNSARHTCSLTRTLPTLKVVYDRDFSRLNALHCFPECHCQKCTEFETAQARPIQSK